MFSFQELSTALEQNDLGKTLSTYAILAKTGFATKTIMAEIEKYPDSRDMIHKLNETDPLMLENRLVIADIFYQCKTQQNSKEQVELDNSGRKLSITM